MDNKWYINIIYLIKIIMRVIVVIGQAINSIGIMYIKR